jgi:hypothetical protein
MVLVTMWMTHICTFANEVANKQFSGIKLAYTDKGLVDFTWLNQTKMLKKEAVENGHK